VGDTIDETLTRRTFLAVSAGAGVVGTALPGTDAAIEAAEAVVMPPRPKSPAKVLAAFLYPPADVVSRGEMEDGWRVHQWFTWPGNQFQPEAQERKFGTKINQMAQQLGVEITYAPAAIYRQTDCAAFIEGAKARKCDAVLIVNFWNTLSDLAYRMATESAPTAIVYHSVGSNHQLPPEKLRKAEGVHYIHSIENWDEIERGLRSVRAIKALAQSRLIRVAGRPQTGPPQIEPRLGVEIVGVPAAEFNATFDAVPADDAIVREAMAFKRRASRVMDVTDEYFVEGFRSHRAVKATLERYGGDAITIDCLMLKHRKPCISFALNNGDLTPCGCENDLNASLTLMLGRWLFDRGGFQHNPEFDTSENLYFGAHCTCAPKLHGPGGPAMRYMVRPFFHQAPKTAALDVQWTPDQRAFVAKYQTADGSLSCWTGSVVGSPASPPTGGCATRVLLKVDGVGDVCDIYRGPHPVMFCGDTGDARTLKVFARMARLTVDGNV